MWLDNRLAFYYSTNKATTDIYSLSLHDALPISPGLWSPCACTRHTGAAGAAVSPTVAAALWTRHPQRWPRPRVDGPDGRVEDRKSTRLNSSHPSISYAVFCLKKKKKSLKSLV